MKSYKLILTSLSLLFLASCRTHSQSPNVTFIPKNPQTQRPEAGQSNLPTQSQPINNNGVVTGPSDGGGGDTCNGKMIESYKIYISQQKEFQSYVEPILKQTIQNKNDTSGSPFIFSGITKNWYIIDCKLDQIPQARKGLFFTTDQTAIQTNKEIFINSDLYKKMQPEEKAKLILHELVMSFYLVKFKSLKELCIDAEDMCSDNTDEITNWKMFRPEEFHPLNAEDHQRVRNVTAWLWENRDKIDYREFADLIKSNNFDKRFSDVSLADENEHEEFDLDVDSFVRMLKKYQWGNLFPQYCQFDSVKLQSHSLCQTELTAQLENGDFSFAKNVKLLKLLLKITRASDKKVISEEFLMPIPTDKFHLYINNMGPLLRTAPLLRLLIGHNIIWINFKRE